MLLAPTPVDENQRLDAVLRLNLLYSEREERFDRLTRIIHSLFGIPTVYITLIDKQRVWYKSSFGDNSIEERRDISFCGHAICNTVTNDISSRFLEVLDAKEDSRFIDNPFVTQNDGVRYYLGFVLQSVDRENIGTLCMIDIKPRSFTEPQKKLFYDLGLMVEKEINRPVLENQLSASNFDEDSKNLHLDKLQNITLKLDLIKNKFNSTFKKHNINYQEWMILNEILKLEFASPNVLSKKLYHSAPMMTRKLDILESKSLTKRWNAKEGDRRFVQIECTNLGKKVWAKGSKEIEDLAKVHLKNIISFI